VRGRSHVGRRLRSVADERGLETTLVAGGAADHLVEGAGLGDDLPDQLLANAREPVGQHHGGGEREPLRMCLGLRGQPMMCSVPDAERAAHSASPSGRSGDANKNPNEAEAPPSAARACFAASRPQIAASEATVLTRSNPIAHVRPPKDGLGDP